MLEIANLEVVYHRVVLVLQGVSIRVPDRGVVALLGPNGAGKTTLLRAVTGLLDVHEGEATKGSVTFDGEALLGLPPETVVRRGVTQVMEGRRILADLTVEENLLAGAYTASRADARRNLERFYTRFPILAERRGQSAGYLSGGEQQMLAIARALMRPGKLLLLDEPSLGLAPSVVADVSALIREIEAEGRAILLVEQNAHLALSLASHGYILDTGKIVMEGSAEELREDEDVKEFYLGFGREGQASFRSVKHYRRRKRWLS